jgi:GDPmannose 4,6-dehydratase
LRGERKFLFTGEGCPLGWGEGKPAYAKRKGKNRVKKALICGVSGQDGAYLAQLLLDRGYIVCGTSRDAQVSAFRNLARLGISDRLKLESVALNDFRSVLQVLVKFQPDEVYNLAGQTSVGLSFEQPVETLESISVGTLNLLEAIRFIGKPIKLYNAGSSECFGDTGDRAADENTPFRPRSPYGVAKAAAFWQVANYREAYGLFACSGILYNHESPLRPARFVTQKIVSTACRIAQGSPEKLHLGNISIQRDWGWAPEYVEAMYLMLQQDRPDDYVIATGESRKLEDFVAAAFDSVGLDWHDYVVTDASLLRPTDIAIGRGNPAKAREKLNWQAQYKMDDVARMMIKACE